MIDKDLEVKRCSCAALDMISSKTKYNTRIDGKKMLRGSNVKARG
jgi:hypothetical protein